MSKVGRKKKPLYLKSQQFSLTLSCDEIFSMAEMSLTKDLTYTQLCEAIEKCRNNIYKNIRS
jgi:hypothetical protein